MTGDVVNQDAMSAGLTETSLLDPLLVKRTVQLLQADPVVQANIRWRRARLCLRESGASAQTIVVDRGSVRWRAGEDDAGLPTVHVTGTRAQWKVILSGQHGGLHRAWRYGELEFGGDPAVTFDLWKTLWRLGEALVIAAEERRRAV